VSATWTREYLVELADALPAFPRGRARLLAEVDDHLQEAAEESMEAGISAEDARRLAIARFGTPAQIADRVRASTLTGRVLAWISHPDNWADGAISVIAGFLVFLYVGGMWAKAFDTFPHALTSWWTIITVSAFALAAATLSHYGAAARETSRRVRPR
jgi:hypothetical protein